MLASKTADNGGPSVLIMCAYSDKSHILDVLTSKLSVKFPVYNLY